MTMPSTKPRTLHTCHIVSIHIVSMPHAMQVRWASFEWQLDQLGDELEELFSCAAELASSLPYPL
jgi:hypothetical protein